jgi:hypothetical protein
VGRAQRKEHVVRARLRNGIRVDRGFGRGAAVVRRLAGVEGSLRG